MDEVASKLEPNPVTGSRPTYNFFGVVATEDLERKKTIVLDTYKLIFRFSIQKLIKYLDDFCFLQLVLQYLKSTQMQRAHTRQVMYKNHVAYYRVVENLINLSSRSHQMHSMMNIILQKNQMEKTSEGHVCLNKLL